MPTPSEAEAAYRSQIDSLLVSDDPNSRESVRLLDEIEAGIDALRRSRRSPLFAEVLQSLGHITLTKAGQLQPVERLHIDGDGIAPYALCHEHIAARHKKALYEFLGAKETPSLSALTAAMQAKPAGPAIFYRRLDAFLEKGRDPSVLEEVACVPTPHGHRSPSAVVVLGRKDYWGRWRTPFRVSSPERIKNLTRLGIPGPQLTAEASKSFFRWLSAQGANALRRHLRILRRHWQEARPGPLAWWRLAADVPCLPVVSAGQLKLIGFAEATEGHVYLPDFPGVHEDVAKTDERYSIVYDKLGQYVALREAGIRSLRSELHKATEIEVTDRLDPVDRPYTELLNVLRRKIRGLPRALDSSGLNRRFLAPGWTEFVLGLSGIRYARVVRARYRLGPHTFVVDSKSGIDNDGVVWLAFDASDVMSLLEALAEHLFKPGDAAAPYKLYRALHHLRASSSITLQEPDQDHEEDRPEGDRGEDSRSDRRPGHWDPSRADPVVPKPEPFGAPGNKSPASNGRRGAAGRRGAGHRGSHSSRGAESRPIFEWEERGKSALKQDHYGFHCQACLGVAQPCAVTPPFTYIYQSTYRNPLIEAHHVEHIQSGGPPGAGNLVVLCKFHHDLLGDKLVPEDIVERLQTAGKATRMFPTDDEGKKTQSVQGLLIGISIDRPPFQQQLFFTKEHADVWLKRATRPD